MKNPNKTVAYFKERKGFDRIFLELRKKWKRNGKCTGVIHIKDASESEKDELRKLLGRRFDDSDIKFSFREFEKAYVESGIFSIPFEQILEAYFGETLLTNKACKELKAKQKYKFFMNLIKQTEDLLIPEAHSFFLQLQKGNTVASSFAAKAYAQSPEILQAVLLNAWKAVAYMNDKKTCRLAVLSTDITGNPHYFDRDLASGRALLYVLAYYYNEPFPKKAEEILKLYDIAGIITDEISNFTTAFGIYLFDSVGIHPAFESFVLRKEPYPVSSYHLNQMLKADVEQSIVYVVENQMLFSHLCDVLRDYSVSILCTSGQPKAASLLMLDLLCKSGLTIYYSGDLDPEGILIADRLISRNPKQIVPWHYSVNDYLLSLSNEQLNDHRLKQLDKIKNACFLPLCKAVKQYKKAGYQEALLEQMVIDMINDL